MEGVFFDVDAWMENLEKHRQTHSQEASEGAQWWLERIKQKADSGFLEIFE